MRDALLHIHTTHMNILNLREWILCAALNSTSFVKHINIDHMQTDHRWGLVWVTAREGDQMHNPFDWSRLDL